ncbi:major facilitator superfamily transporter [compost metagenome]
MDTIISGDTTKTSFYAAIAPIILSVFAIYLTIGITLGILPGYIQNSLEFGSVTVGIVIGLQALATLLTRAYAGKTTDTKGAKVSTRLGTILTIMTGILYVASTFFMSNVSLALGIILVARMIHGIAESLFFTGALTWGIGLVGAQKSGRVMTWNGIAMYAGIAIGAPLGIGMTKIFGIESAFATLVLLSIISWLIIKKLPTLSVDLSHVRTPFYKVIGSIAGQGLALAFSSIGFACISSFIALFFVQKQWGDPSLAFVCFGVSYVLVRVFFSSFPDKYGGLKVTLFSLLIEILGQLLIGFSTSKVMAIAGCSLTGAGFSLIFPSLGVLAIKKVNPQMRGTALGAYAAFFDLSLGIAAPIAGLVASWFDYQSVYIFGGVSALLAIVVLLLGKNKA